MAYFNLSTGLRGCYMPDNSCVVRVTTRRDLHTLIRDEAQAQQGDCGELRWVGLSKRAIAAFAAEAWSRRADPRWTMDLALPFGERGNAGSYGIFLSRATRADYLAYQAERDA